MVISAQAQASEENSVSSWPRPIVSRPGRTMISTPTKPTAIALQRRRRTTSPRISAARMVAKIGAVKPSAVTSASGVIAERVEERQHRQDVERGAQDVQAEARRAQRLEPVAHEPGQDHEEREDVAEEGDLERMQPRRDLADRGVHRGEEEGRDEHQQDAAQRVVAAGTRGGAASASRGEGGGPVIRRAAAVTIGAWGCGCASWACAAPCGRRGAFCAQPCGRAGCPAPHLRSPPAAAGRPAPDSRRRACWCD